MTFLRHFLGECGWKMWCNDFQSADCLLKRRSLGSKLERRWAQGPHPALHFQGASRYEVVNTCKFQLSVWAVHGQRSRRLASSWRQHPVLLFWRRAFGVPFWRPTLGVRNGESGGFFWEVADTTEHYLGMYVDIHLRRHTLVSLFPPRLKPAPTAEADPLADFAAEAQPASSLSQSRPIRQKDGIQ